MTLEPDAPPILEAGSRSPARRVQVIELLVFLFLIVPSLVLSFFAVQQNVGFVLVAVSTILRDLSLLSLVAFFAWRNGESMKAMGWRFSHWPREALIGAILFVPAFFGAGLLESFLRSVGLSTGSTSTTSLLTPTGVGQLVLASVLVIVVAIAEETIFRGYLILRFGNITRSAAAAVVLSAFVFSLGHGYEGSAGVVTVGILGLAFAVIYLWRRSLVAPMVMHFLQDFIGIVVVSILRVG